MTRARLQLRSGVVLDARRAVYLEEESVLAVADLHFGYAWAHRSRGQLMPLSVPEDTGERLEILLDEYRPRTLAILGDIVHEAVPVAEFRSSLKILFERIEQRVELQLIAGNHDRWLCREITQPLVRDYQVGPHRLIHGDGFSESAAEELMAETRNDGGFVIMGHEHPAMGISDGVAHFARVPCFFTSDELLILPAFSRWAAGCDLRRGEFLSPFPSMVESSTPVAILAEKLLRMRRE